MKKLTLKYILGYALFLLLVFLISNSKVLALDYYLPSKFAGKETNSTFWLESEQRLSGAYSYKRPTNTSVGDYLDISFCATGNVTTYTVDRPNIQRDPITIDTGEWCTTGSYSGTIKHSYFLVTEWTYTADSGYAYIDGSSDSFFYNSSSYSAHVLFYGIANISELDMSMAILAYLKSTGNKDYNSVLNEIKANQESYKQELNTVNDSIQQGNQNLTDIKEELTNDSVEDSTSKANEFFNGFTTDTFGLTSIITAPLTLIGSITSSSCSPLGLKVPFLDNKTLNLPCMSSIYQQHFGSFLTIYQTITFGLIAYWVCVRIFALVKDFKNPDEDKVEVLDL